MSDTAVRRNDDTSRYEITVDGTLAGFAEFERRPGAIRFTHTEVDPASRAADSPASSRRTR